MPAGLLFVAVKLDVGATVGKFEPTVHGWGGEGHYDMSLPINRNTPAASTEIVHLLHGFSAGLLQRQAFVFHEGGKIVAENRADIIFANASSTYGTGGVIGVSARANHGSVTNPARQLVGSSAGRGGGGQIAVFIEGDTADRSERLRV